MPRPACRPAPSMTSRRRRSTGHDGSKPRSSQPATNASQSASAARGFSSARDAFEGGFGFGELVFEQRQEPFEEIAAGRFGVGVALSEQRRQPVQQAVTRRGDAKQADRRRRGRRDGRPDPPGRRQAATGHPEAKPQVAATIRCHRFRKDRVDPVGGRDRADQRLVQEQGAGRGVGPGGRDGRCAVVRDDRDLGARRQRPAERQGFAQDQPAGRGRPGPRSRSRNPRRRAPSA